MNSKEKLCLITGATDGIGKATAVRLAGQGYKIIIVARNAAKASLVIEEIAAANNRAKPEYLVADLSSQDDVSRMISEFKERHEKLDILINNAGVVMPEASLTVDGFETTFQVNYLSPFIITNALLGHLRKSDDRRIINVTSNVYAMGKFDIGKMYGEGRYSPLNAYAASKLYLLMFTEELSKKMGKDVTVNAAHPGIVRTNMSTRLQEFPFLFKAISFVAMPFAITPEKGAATSFFLATSDTVRNISGEYFENCKIVKTRNRFDTPANRERLWDLSMKIWKRIPIYEH